MRKFKVAIVLSSMMAGVLIFASVAVSAASHVYEIVIDGAFHGPSSNSYKLDTDIWTGLQSAGSGKKHGRDNHHFVPVSLARELAPEAILESEITLTLTHLGNVGSGVRTDRRNRSNLASPVAIDGNLFVADQFGGTVYRFDERPTGGTFTEVFSVATSPPDNLSFKDKVSILNIADGPGQTVYIVFTAQDLPPGVTPEPLPKDDRYLLKRMNLKWSQKSGQLAKVYPEPLEGYENGETPEVYRSVQGEDRA